MSYLIFLILMNKGVNIIMRLHKTICKFNSFLSKILRQSYIPLIFISILLINSPVSGGGKGYIKPAPKDKCPVCGMFVAKYTEWIAQVIFRDGTYRVFDGSKDMFKYLADMNRYEPSRKKGDIESIYVTDYYDVRPIDANKAFFVTGSDIYGPMGAEFVPFNKESDAMVFKKDHNGKQLLKFNDVTPAVLKTFE
jgi:copper chaperone NosL